MCEYHVDYIFKITCGFTRGNGGSLGFKNIKYDFKITRGFTRGNGGHLDFDPFVTRPGDLRDLGRPFRYEPRRSPGLNA